MTIPNSEEFVEEYTNEETEEQSFKLGVVVSLFPINTAKITFDGEDEVSEKQYSYLSHYKPTVGDRVLLASVSGTYIILGKVNYNVAPPSVDATPEPGSFTTLSASQTTTLAGLSTSALATLHSLVVSGSMKHNGTQLSFFNTTLQNKKQVQYAGNDTVVRDRLNSLIQRLGEYGLITPYN